MYWVWTTKPHEYHIALHRELADLCVSDQIWSQLQTRARYHVSMISQGPSQSLISPECWNSMSERNQYKLSLRLKRKAFIEHSGPSQIPTPWAASFHSNQHVDSTIKYFFQRLEGEPHRCICIGSGLGEGAEGRRNSKQREPPDCTRRSDDFWIIWLIRWVLTNSRRQFLKKNDPMVISETSSLIPIRAFAWPISAISAN